MYLLNQKLKCCLTIKIVYSSVCLANFLRKFECVKHIYIYLFLL
jgi:hypothetical protein